MLLGASPKVITEVAAKALEFWEQQREWEAGLSRNETERKQAEMAELQERLHRCDAHRQQVIKQLEEGKHLQVAGPQITSKVCPPRLHVAPIQFCAAVRHSSAITPFAGPTEPHSGASSLMARSVQASAKLSFLAGA